MAYKWAEWNRVGDIGVISYLGVIVASQSTIQALVTLQVAASSAELIKLQVSGQRGSAPVLKHVKAVLSAIDRIRPLWPALHVTEQESYVKALIPVYQALKETGGLPGHTLTWLARMFLEHCMNQAWSCGSKKGGALDSVLRHIEDLHAAMLSDDERECWRQARGIFNAWLDRDRVKKGWRVAV